MDNNAMFKLKVYEQQLSPFGKSVFQTLVKQWQERQSTTAFRHPRQPPQNKKILSFRSDEPLLPMAQNGTPRVGSEEQSKQVPTSTELIQPLDETESVHTTNMRDNLITTVIDWRDAPEILVEVPETCDNVLEIRNVAPETWSDVPQTQNDASEPWNAAPEIVYETSESRDKLFNFDLESSKENVRGKQVETANETNPVEWGDMFDTELFQDITTPTKAEVRGNTTEIRDPIEDDNVASKEINNVKKKKVVEKKRKAQTKITDTNPKKVKKASKEIEKPKNSFRKQKYTKAVKNWLNDVDPNNPVDEEILEQTDKRPVVEITKESNNNTKKKVVQTQLANKDGIMKFGIAKNIEKVDSEKDISKVKDNVKHKKVPKFVAPIKSQIPIRDVTYEVIVVDGSNVEDIVITLDTVRSSDMALVLCYSNGYSQLNVQHTDESCIPEGIMLSILEKFYYFKESGNAYRQILSIILKNNTIICYEGKHILIFLKSKYFLEVDELNIVDAKIAGSLLNVDSPPEMFSELQKLVSFAPQYTIATECVHQKTAWYLTMLRECWEALQAMLVEQTMWNVFVDIEMKLLPVIADMEQHGVCVDIPKLKSMEEILLTKMKAVEQECYKAAGKSFQINSTVQVRAILYDELKLDSKCNVKIRETVGIGAKSTSETMLRSLIAVHPLPKLILEYRHLHKAHATFLTGISQHIKNGVVKPTWVQTAAVTGRIASNNPNLQAIPKGYFSLVMFPEVEDQGQCGQLSFRSVYISRAGHSLVCADFKHIECRVFAHIAADTSLLALLRGSQDLFKVLAAKWLNKDVDVVSSEDRERTKRTVYASLYGAGARRLTDVLGIGYDQALAILTSLNRTFPSLKCFGRSVVRQCSGRGGRLATVCGRARTFKHIDSGDGALRAQAERQAVNFVVQGSAADLCKRAMCGTARALRPLGGRLLLTIHDELVWELPDHNTTHAAAIIKRVMEECGRECGMDMTLPVAISTGRNWGEMTPLLL